MNYKFKTGRIDSALRRLDYFKRNTFLQDLFKLVIGTLGGRFIALAVLPLATRLYSPEDFATLATCLSVVAIIAVGACLRFDIAIPLAETDEDAANLLVLSITSLLGIGLLSFIAVLLVPQPLSALLGRPELEPWLWLVPLGVILAASYSALQFWATRARRFGSIARTRVTQATWSAATLLGLGLAGIAPLGLLVGSMLNTGAGGIKLGLEALQRDRPLLDCVSKSRMRDVFIRYRRYPIYSAPEALANVAGIQLPIVMIAAFAGAEAGFLMLATQIAAAPLSLLGASIAQVYMSRAPEELRAGRLAGFTLEIVRRLVQIGVGPVILAGLVAPVLFPLVFGRDWARAGEIVTWLVPWISLQLLASPISMVLNQTGRQHWAMALQFFGLSLRVGAVAVAGFWYTAGAVPAMAVAAAAFYAIYLAVNLRAAGVSLSAATRSIAGGVIYTVPWIAAGVIVRLSMN